MADDPAGVGWGTDSGRRHDLSERIDTMTDVLVHFSLAFEIRLLQMYYKLQN